MKITDKATVEHLNFLVRTYDAVTSTCVSTKNRLCHLSPDSDSAHDEIVNSMESMKGKISRHIEKLLDYWPIWTHWMKDVPGIGPAIGSKLIMLYYYRFVPVCKDCGSDLIKNEGYECSACGKKAKRDGVLQYRLELKEFNKVSSWWHYMGMHCDDTGRKPKRKSGVVSSWSTEGRTLGYQIGEQFIKQKGPYRAFYDLRKAKREKTHSEATPLHRNNMARHETAKLFLAHFIQVAKTLDGEEFTKPYAHTVMGHTNFIEPFLFEAA